MAASSTPERTVIVGVDGSDTSLDALHWAADHADQLGAVCPVLTFVPGPLERGFGTVEGSDGSGEPYRTEAETRLEKVLREHAPALLDVATVIESRPGPGLVHAAEGSELLVVGTRGWGVRDDLSLGSVGSYCARHSRVPVALVPPGDRPVREHLAVTIGFDGSQHARTALRWTLTHVRPDARVVVVWAHPSESVVGEPLSPSPEVAATRARQELDDGVAAILDDLPGHASVETRVVSGDARAALRSASVDADLLVIGSRGLGVLDRLLLGSVADALVHHPTVPTIVVPHDADRS